MRPKIHLTESNRIKTDLEKTTNSQGWLAFNQLINNPLLTFILSLPQVIQENNEGSVNYQENSINSHKTSKMEWRSTKKSERGKRYHIKK